MKRTKAQKILVLVVSPYDCNIISYGKHAWEEGSEETRYEE